MTNRKTNLGFALGILFCVNVINFTDRMILSVLSEPIKAEFVLSDTQMGLSAGFAFAIFYAVEVFLIAGVAERINRVRLVSVLIVIWSGFTALTGVALNFW